MRPVVACVAIPCRPASRAGAPIPFALTPCLGCWAGRHPLPTEACTPTSSRTATRSRRTTPRLMRSRVRKTLHVINYAYALYKTAEWKEVFGPFRRPYRDLYRPVPFSRNFVRHMEGWYAQKHPDEDFAETFAVWLTPRSRWRERYKNWPAMQKLRYVDRMAHRVADMDPVRKQGDTDITVEEMETTVDEFYERAMSEQPSSGDLALDTDLEDIFNVSPRKRKGVRPAEDLLRENRQSLVQKLTYWSGVQRPLVKKLVESIENRVAELQLKAEIQREKEYLTEITVYATALAMNYVARGKFVPTAEKGTAQGTGYRVQGTANRKSQIKRDIVMSSSSGEASRKAEENKL